MKVMVVDDVMFMRKILSDKLRKLGHEVIESENGEDAIVKCRRENPEVIFMDLVMPKMDGITAIKRIREDEVAQGKIVICSVLSDRNRVIDAFKAGAHDYLVKPFDDIRLREALQRLKE